VRASSYTIIRNIASWHHQPASVFYLRIFPRIIGKIPRLFLFYGKKITAGLYMDRLSIVYAAICLLFACMQHMVLQSKRHKLAALPAAEFFLDFRFVRVYSLDAELQLFAYLCNRITMHDIFKNLKFSGA